MTLQSPSLRSVYLEVEYFVCTEAGKTHLARTVKVAAIDCVGANQYVLPEPITLLVAGFSSGDAGLPRHEAQGEALKYIAATGPKTYMPHAGLFEEQAMTTLRANYANIVTVDPLEQDMIEWKNGEIATAIINQPPRFTTMEDTCI